MGLLHRETQRVGEMYFLLVLLLSPASGMPRSAQLEVGVEIVNELDSFVGFNQEAKSYLRETRSELRNLARRNVKAVRDLKHLLEDVDKNEDRVLFKLSIKKMKDLMIETLKSLEAARETYKSALEAYDNLISSVATQNTILEKVVNSTTAEFEIDRKYTNKVSKACAIASYFTFGLCTIIHYFVNEVPLEVSRLELVDLKSITDEMVERGADLKYDITEAIDILTEEIELINIWANRAEVVRSNIDEYSVQYLRKYKTIRTVFKNGLDDLKRVAERFLAQPMYIL